MIEKNKIMSLVCRMGVSALDEMPGDNCQVIWRNAFISSAFSGTEDDFVREKSDIIDVESKHDEE